MGGHSPVTAEVLAASPGRAAGGVGPISTTEVGPAPGAFNSKSQGLWAGSEGP